MKENRELKNRIQVLEGQIRDRDGQIAELKTLLNERDRYTERCRTSAIAFSHSSGVAQVRVHMEQRLQEQQKQFMQANTQLKNHLETMVRLKQKPSS